MSSDDEEQSLTTTLQLRLHASKLPRFGITKSPPSTFAHCTFVGGPFAPRDTKPQEWGRTEIISKYCHPQWTTDLTTDYTYGTQKFFFVRVLRHHKHHPDAPSQIGSALFEIGDIMGTHNRTKVKRLRTGGCLTAQLEPVRQSSQQQEVDTRIFVFQFRAMELLNKKSKSNSSRASVLSSMNSRSPPDTVIEVAKQRQSSTGNSWVAIYRSGPVYNSYEPTWDRGEIDFASSCHGDPSWPIRISIWNYKKGHPDTLIGVCETTVEKLINACIGDDDDDEDIVDQISEKDLILTKLNHEGKQVGTIRVTRAALVEKNDRRAEEAEPPVMPSSSLFGTASESFQSSTGVPPTPARSTGSAVSANRYSSNGGGGGGNGAAPMSVIHLNDSFASSVGSTADLMNDSFAAPPCEILLPPMIEDTPRMTRPRFKQYVDSGCEIDLCFAINFTSSNGDPRVPGTLHYQTSDSLNDYEEAITAIGDALASFNNSHEYPVYGFGAKFGGVVRHIFQVGPSTTVHGIDGVLDAYQSVFRSDLVMSGPTVYAQVIQAAAIRARKYHETMEQCRRYCVLLIITDGMVDNIEETQRKLRVYRDMPLSVIIIGVGRADFRRMNALCNQPQSTPTSFVAFRQHQHDPLSMAKAALDSLPHQIVDYMSTNLSSSLLSTSSETVG